MVHILHILTADYNLQLALLLRRITDNEKPLAVEKIGEELSLVFERLSNKSSNNESGEESEEMALLGGQFKGKSKHSGKTRHKSFESKNCTNHNHGNNNGNTNGRIYCTYCWKPEHAKPNCYCLS
jgi:hypothetical protein